MLASLGELFDIPLPLYYTCSNNFPFEIFTKR